MSREPDWHFRGCNNANTFSSDPSLIKPLAPSLLKGIIISLAIVAGLFAIAYLPQVAILAFVSGPLGESARDDGVEAELPADGCLAFVAAVPLVLGEAYVLINFVMKSFIFGQAGIDLFDTVRPTMG